MTTTSVYTADDIADEIIQCFRFYDKLEPSVLAHDEVPDCSMALHVIEELQKGNPVPARRVLLQWMRREAKKFRLAIREETKELHDQQMQHLYYLALSLPPEKSHD